MSIVITNNNNIIKVATFINSIETNLLSNNILTDSESTNISISTTSNNIDIKDFVVTSSDISDLEENIDDRVNLLLKAGNYINLNYNDNNNELIISTTGLLPSGSIIIYPELSNSSTESLNIQKRVAKAWINFNGTGVVSIRDDFNISNIIDNGVGDYTINFSTPFLNTNYTFVAWARDFNTDVYVTSGLGAKSNTPKTTSSIRVIFNYLLNGINYDSSECNLIFFSS